MRRFIVPALLVCLLSVPIQAQVSNFTSTMDDVPTSGWTTNNLSQPLGSTTWQQGVLIAAGGPFDQYEGSGYLSTNYNNTSGVGTISNWHMSPHVTITSGSTFSFWTRKPAPDTYPDRLEVRLSTNGTSLDVGSTSTSVGDFTTLLLSINPTLVTGVYPTTWTQFTVTIPLGIPAGTTGRIAFRYFVTNGGINGANSDYIGIDLASWTTNPAPVTTNDDFVVAEDVLLTGNVLSNDSEPNGQAMTAAVVSPPAVGVLVFDTNNGDISYTPPADYFGQVTFTYKAIDFLGAESAPATVTIDVAPVNDPPVPTFTSLTTDEDVAAAATLAATDVEANPLTFAVTVQPSNGSLSGTEPNLTYTPAANFNGSDSFTYTVSDGIDAPVAQVVSITVDPVADVPVAADDSYNGASGTQLAVDAASGVLANDSDGDNDSLTAAVVATTQYGTLSLAADGSFTYDPEPGVTGTDTFTYQANDGAANSNLATVTINIAQSVPTITLLTPNNGIHTGGTAVTLTGTNFQPGAAVTVGGIDAGAVYVSDTELTFTSPAFAGGTLQDVVVENPDAATATLDNGWMSDFLDVPQSHGLHDFVESIFRVGITGGCGGGNYCPNNSVTRAQMAVFLLVAKEGMGYAPPAASGTLFGDVPANGFAASWIEELANRGITTGCGAGNYCPTSRVTRAQMAVFLLATKEPAGYVPPDPTGVFDDVAVSNGFARWIEELAARGITGGCSVNPPLYCPSGSATRGQMAVFLKVTFSLP